MLYRFEVELSDIDRGIYASLNFRLNQHPSETLEYLLTRAIAFVLQYHEKLEVVGEGLGDPDAPALKALDDRGNVELWIEIGNPSARKLHKATKVAKQVAVYTYKNPQNLLQELRAADVHKANELLIFSLDAKFLAELEAGLQKNNQWSVLIQDGQVDVGVGDEGETISTRIAQHFVRTS